MRQITKGDLVIVTNGHFYEFSARSDKDIIIGVVVNVFDQYDGFDKIPIDETAVKVYSSGTVNWYWLQQLVPIDEYFKA
jgi:hypothetical protein